MTVAALCYSCVSYVDARCSSIVLLCLILRHTEQQRTRSASEMSFHMETFEGVLRFISVQNN